MSQRERTTFVVACPDCGVRKGVERPNEAIAFYRRHHGLTGHDIEWERAEFEGGDVPTEGDVKTVVSTLDRRFDGGVPLGVVAAAMSHQGATIGETLAEVRALRMNGELYEPRDDRLGVT